MSQTTEEIICLYDHETFEVTNFKRIRRAVHDRKLQKRREVVLEQQSLIDKKNRVKKLNRFNRHDILDVI